MVREPQEWISAQYREVMTPLILRITVEGFEYYMFFIYFLGSVIG